jgi:hypothetical protein
MSALEVNEIYMSTLVEEPLEIIEELCEWSRSGAKHARLDSFIQEIDI